jgi:hypothetical protein
LVVGGGSSSGGGDSHCSSMGMSMSSFQWSMMVGMTARMPRMPRMPASLALVLSLAGAGQLIIT